MTKKGYTVNKRYLGPHPPKLKKIKVDFLILGHPRSGTGYISKLFSSYGINIGHECIDTHGISCWTFVTPNCNPFMGAPNNDQKSIKKTTRQDLKYDYLIHNIRNPFDVINSIYQTEAKSYSQIFRLFHTKPKIDENLNTLEQTILSVVRWNRMIEKLNPDVVFKVEDCEKDVKEYLKKLNYHITDNVFKNKNYNTRRDSKNKLTVNNYKNVTSYILDELNEYCKKYNYKNILKS